MHILFEEDGHFRTGTLLIDNDSSLQVETASGKRSKIKSGNVLLRFQTPSPTTLIPAAEPIAREMDLPFLWECASDEEFLFSDFANEYFGHTANAIEASALLLALHSGPIYFHRKGKGRFRKAPPEILAAALTGLQKKQALAERIEHMSQALLASRLPPEFSPQLIDELLFKPDRNRPETKALEVAASEAGLSTVHLLARCGAIPSAYTLHLRRFTREHFPEGLIPEPCEPIILSDTLPEASVRAFSIDDASTTEIDDAFSVEALPDGAGWRIGIHIAALGLGLRRGHPAEAIARKRLSTVYMPGSKMTMLPEALIQEFSLNEGEKKPAVSLYLTCSPNFEILSHESCIETVHIVQNLRLHTLEPLFNKETLATGLSHFEWSSALETLWHVACAAEKRRGKPSSIQGLHDYHFSIEGDLADPERCTVGIAARLRGSPIDKIVSELMIIANSLWGGALANSQIAALYRAQTGGKVRMTTAPLPHEGLGVPQYAWLTSPLRRYIDLLNQWQLIAWIRNEPPEFMPRAEGLFAALQDFEIAYANYADFQRSMERYWCLRWLLQEGHTSALGHVRRDDLVRFDAIPIISRVAGLPNLPTGTPVRFAIESIDLLTQHLSCRYLEHFETMDSPSTTDPEEID